MQWRFLGNEIINVLRDIKDNRYAYYQSNSQEESSEVLFDNIQVDRFYELIRHLFLILKIKKYDYR